MNTARPRLLCSVGLALAAAALSIPTLAAQPPGPDIGIAVRNITPEMPIRLAGYAGRKRPADKRDHPLLVQALAMKNPSGERFVFVALDNCEVSHAFMQPVRDRLKDTLQLEPGTVAVVSSHTHSAPVLEQTLTDMTQPTPDDQERIQRYSRSLHGFYGPFRGAIESHLIQRFETMAAQLRSHPWTGNALE